MLDQLAVGHDGEHSSDFCGIKSGRVRTILRSPAISELRPEPVHDEPVRMTAAAFRPRWIAIAEFRRPREIQRVVVESAGLLSEDRNKGAGQQQDKAADTPLHSQKRLRIR